MNKVFGIINPYIAFEEVFIRASMREDQEKEEAELKEEHSEEREEAKEKIDEQIEEAREQKENI